MAQAPLWPELATEALDGCPLPDDADESCQRRMPRRLTVETFNEEGLETPVGAKRRAHAEQQDGDVRRHIEPIDKPLGHPPNGVDVERLDLGARVRTQPLQ